MTIPLEAHNQRGRLLKSLPARMTMSVLGLTFAFGALLVTSVLYQATQTYKDQFLDGVRGRALALSEVVSRDPSPGRVRSLFDGILLGRRITYAEFLPAPGVTIAAIRQQAAGSPATFQEDFAFGEHDDNTYFISAPVNGKNDTALGELRLGFDESLVTGQINHLIQRSVVFAIVFLWALLLASISLALRMSNPLRLLQKASRSIASGEIQQELHVSTQIVEIADLARDLEKMRQELLARSHKLATSEARYSAILRHAADAIITLDQNANIEGYNLAAENLFGFSQNEVIGHPFARLLVRDEHRLPFSAGDWERFCGGKTFAGRRKDASTFTMTLAASSFDSGSARLVALVAHDISGRVAFEQEMNELAFFDALTQLPNRRLFHDRLGHSLELARRNEQQLAVLFLDLDGFKAVNDRYGHQTGDVLLIAVANRLRALLRTSDTVARLGGDEFTIILLDLKHELAIRSVAQKIVNSFATPFDILDCDPITISTSVGVTVFPKDDSDSATLIEHADAAMYFAKKDGKNNYRMYSDEIGADIDLARQARSAINTVELAG